MNQSENQNQQHQNCFSSTFFPYITNDLSFSLIEFNKNLNLKTSLSFKYFNNYFYLINQLESLKIQLNKALQENQILRFKLNSIQTNQVLNIIQTQNVQQNQFKASLKSASKIQQYLQISKKQCGTNKQVIQDKKGKKVKDQSEESYNPQTEQKMMKSQNKQVVYKTCDTKNIIKNFSRAFITYFFKNREITMKILNKHKIENKEEFYRYLKLKRQKIQSICALRQVWLQDQNKFAKIMRVLSFDFLRKRYLHHTLHSKIKNVSRTIKYRQKLMESLKRPEQFTLMKQF